MEEGRAGRAAGAGAGVVWVTWRMAEKSAVEDLPGSCGASWKGGRYCQFAASSAARRRFSMSMTLVIGPVPPGTGVSMPATSADAGLVAVALEAGVGVGRAEVDDDGARLHPVRLDHLGPADGQAEDVCLPADAGQVDRAAVGDGDGGVAMEQEQRHGLADDVAAPHDDRLFALEFDAGLFQQLDGAGGRRRDEEGRSIRCQAARIQRVHAVDILPRIEQVDEGRMVDMGRHRFQDHDAVDFGRLIEVAEHLRHLVLVTPRQFHGAELAPTPSQVFSIARA